MAMLKKPRTAFFNIWIRSAGKRYMPIRSLCTLGGAYALGLLSALPEDYLFLPLALLIGISARLPRIRLLAWFLLGFAAMWLAAWIVIDDRLDPAIQGETISVVARIVDFPRATNETMRFNVQPVNRPDLPERVRLSWYEPETVPALGEVWHLHVRLRRPHGYSNPGGFDYEGWLFRQQIGATGYVVSHPDNRRLDTLAAGRISRYRQEFVTRVTALLPDDDAAAVLLAVAVGARHRITREQWDRYAFTGTIHLMAISGLHIGLAAGGVFFLAWAVFALLCRRMNVRDMALVTAVLAAGIYAAVSGFAVPAQRAFLMAAFAAAAVLLRRRLNPAALLAVPCLALFFLNPVAIHAPGFKLSFAAVAILLWSLQSHYRPPSLRDGGRFNQPWVAKASGNLRRLGKLQIALLTGLFPLTTLIFGRFSLIAPLMNLLILPLFNFITVPFCLLGMICQGPLQQLGDALLIVAYHSIRQVLALVSFAVELPGVRTEILPPEGLMILIAMLPVGYVMFPAGWPGRKLAWIAMVAVLLYRPAPSPPGCLDYHVLDVGQGLSVVLRTNRQTVLFDTGPTFRSGSSTADLVVIPFLKSRGIDRLDTFVVSHADQDHAGGAETIARRFSVGTVFVGEMVPGLGLQQTHCSKASSWTADGVQFQFLHPPPDAAWEGNNASCVLEVATGNHKLLITGDIETPVEATLVENHSIGPVNTVIVPHHGSRTSSSPDFVRTLKPELAIVSAGFGNRWGFPKDDVVRRWEHVGARLLETATSGAIGQRICVRSGISTLSRERLDSRKYWHEFHP
jgi:competence protein ComEC